MESLPLIVKSKVVPNLDVTSLVREIFQKEFESYVPSKKLSENLRKSLEYERFNHNERDGQETYRSVSYLENLPNEKGKLMDYAESVLEAYGRHEEALNRITKVELNIMEIQATYLKREMMIEEDHFLKDSLRLKRYPLMKSCDAEYVKEYKLLRGESGLPPKHEADLDFRLKNFEKWKKRLSDPSKDGSMTRCANKEVTPVGKTVRKVRVTRPKKAKVAREERRVMEVFRSDATAICFTDFNVGDVYESLVTVRNVHTKPMRVRLKPLPLDSPFKVEMRGTESTRILPGLAFKLLVTFKPRSLDDEDESIVLSVEDGSELVIPVASYLEPPILKTHEDLNERTKKASDKIRSSCIDCGPCFPGDSKVTKIRFHSFGGTGEFFLMSQDNWSNWHVELRDPRRTTIFADVITRRIHCPSDPVETFTARLMPSLPKVKVNSHHPLQNLTPDNFTEIPPFRFYPSYFRVDKSEVIDFFVEFKPPTSGLHSDSVVIACSNGEIRSLDILGDGIAYNRAFFLFEDSLEKNFSPVINDDHRAGYYLDMGSTMSTGRKERVFSVTNDSNMPFEFRWEMRDAVIPFGGQTEPGKLTHSEVKVEPASGVFEADTKRTFHASVSVDRKPVGQYRTVLSLYVIGLPYESIEQASTIIRPSVLRGRFKSGSVFGEEDNLLVSPEFSYQGTFESVREGKKTSAEVRLQQQFPATVCRKHPSICAIPLKRSKTFSNIGDGGDVCTCSAAPKSEAEDAAKPCEFNNVFRKPNITDLGSDLLWDFVDVLVEEVEVWLEVVPADVRIEPCIVNLNSDVRVYEHPVQYEVYVHNYSDFPVTCKWVKFIGKVKLRFDESDEELNTLYQLKGDKEGGQFEVKEEDGEWDDQSESVDSSDGDYRIKCYISQRCCVDYQETDEDASANRHCDVRIKPKGPFTVPPLSRTECTVYVSANQPGIINRVLYLVVDDADEQKMMYIIGRVPDHEITVSPTVLDFGARRSGARFTKFFKIKSLSGERIEWKVEQYSLNYDKGVLTGPIDETTQSGLSHVRRMLEEEGCTIEKYKLDARKPGLQTTLLKFDLACPSYAKAQSAYILVLADVQTPELAIEAPRFENAILAPSRTMYVGQVINQNIVLRNVTNVTTTFIWGYPFGCHARKLKVKMIPKYRVIRSLKTVVVQVRITPLEEGIVEHFYVPCFFSRKVNPVILSIIGVVKHIQVTFSVGRSDQAGSTMKISWPIKNFDPLIGMSYIPEGKILDFECHCDEIDEEYVKAVNTELEKGEEVTPDVEEQEEEGKSCVMKYYTPKRMMELRKGILQKKGLCPNTEDATEEMGSDEQEEEKKWESVSTVAEYPKKECIDALYYAASELQFLNVLHKTAAVRYFVIKNESPLTTHFSLAVKYFGKVERRGGKNKIQEIKKRVFGREKGSFEDGLIYGQPLLITTSPSEGFLEGFDSVRVSVFVYGNTWGEYRDFIICNICGVPPFIMKVFVQLSGHPIHFPMFKPSLGDVPVLRFNTVKYKADPIVRTIRVGNTSSIPVTVTWMVFLTSPLPEDAKEEPFNLCIDLYTDKESEDPAKTTKSSQNYLSKNTSGSVPFLDMMDMEKTSSQCTGMEQMSEVDSSKRTSPMVIRCSEGEATPAALDSTKPEIQLLENFGKIDLSVFQVYPRELDIDPHSEQKISVTFNPGHHEQSTPTEDFEAVVTGCIRLRQEYSNYPDIYHRPCGKDYVSKLLVMSASVERPLLQFEFTTSDLQYIVNANDVLKSKNQECRLTKKFIVRNRNSTPIAASVRSLPGDVFTVKRIETSRTIYPEYNPDYHTVAVEPGDSIEVHVEAVVTYKHFLEMRKKLKTTVKNEKEDEIHMKESVPVLEGRVVGDSSEDDSEDKKFYYVGTPNSSRSYTDSNFKIKPLDSFLMIQRRATEWRNTVDDGGIACRVRAQSVDDDSFSEMLGEVTGCFLNSLPYLEESKQMDWCHVLKENIIFGQVGLARQVITLELRVYFPFLKLSPEIIDFGNVYIGETSRRYSSVINLTQFPTEFSVASPEETEFLVTPRIAHLPATNYKSDVGVELTVMFAPKEPGYFKTTFRIFGNREKMFGYALLTVIGFGTWNEKYKYPQVDIPTTIILPSGR